MLMNRAMVIFVLTFSVYGEVVRQDYEQATEFAGRANDSAGSSPSANDGLEEYFFSLLDTHTPSGIVEEGWQAAASHIEKKLVKISDEQFSEVMQMCVKLATVLRDKFVAMQSRKQVQYLAKLFARTVRGDEAAFKTLTISYQLYTNRFRTG